MENSSTGRRRGVEHIAWIGNDGDEREDIVALMEESSYILSMIQFTAVIAYLLKAK